METRRFEQDFFAMDTTNVAASITTILKKYPAFTPDFIENILGLDMDSFLIPEMRRIAPCVCSFMITCL